MLQKVDVLDGEVARVADGTIFWHDQEVAWRYRVMVLKRDHGVVLVHNIGWLLLPGNPREHVLLNVVDRHTTRRLKIQRKRTAAAATATAAVI